jgi:radical SAM protein (TIGR01212 family)
LGLGCPNRDGAKGTDGCIFCDPTGSGFAAVPPSVPVDRQIDFMRRKYHEKYSSPLYFMAYFQSFSNTYAPIEDLRKYYDMVLPYEDIVILDISTRPDLVPSEVLCLIESYRRTLDVYLELGLQSSNPETLRILNRGHSLEDWIDSTIRAKAKGLTVITHVILDLPWDSEKDIVVTAELLNRLGVDGVKCHSLYVVKGTRLSDMVENRIITLFPIERYIDRLILFLEHLDPDIVIHRLVSDPPNTRTDDRSKITKTILLQRIEQEMERRETWQGKKWKTRDS